MKQYKFPLQPVLIVDDEEQFLLSAEMTLVSNGINNVLTTSDPRQVLPMLKGNYVSVILLDMIMPHISGQELLPQIITEFPDMPVIVITALNEVETAVESMKQGAFDYLVKPVDEERLVSTIRRALDYRGVHHENRMLKKYLLSDTLEHPEAFEEIITRNAAMRSIFQYVEAIAHSPLPVLITGETGVGKELIARAIHKLSGREGEFVSVNVAGVDDQLFSDTLFGHKKGAFTGADRDRKGLIEQARGGTLFLDEIGDLGMESQVKLLRLLQEGKYYQLGADEPQISTARIVVATNKDLTDLQKKGTFRKDLYYRLQTHLIYIPPLRERKEDIPLLVQHFLKKAAEQLGKKVPTPPRELFTLLKTYHFPGNVRELEGMIFDAVSRHRSGVLSLDAIREKIGIQMGPSTPVSPVEAEEKLDEEEKIIFPEHLPTLKATEHMLIEEALRRAEGNQTIAAQLLGISRRALNNRLSRARKQQS
ncbi:MAG: sigma-54-dependent Fis family transcriptional regulator [Calditrichaeota bacterium]|nr:MAG: sigma-54-dependent Fis family transcriptional regulator [Calditrichota bacterium]